MEDGTKTAVATILAAIVIASSVAAVVPFIGDDEDKGIRTGYFDRFPRDFTPEEKDIGTPAESWAEAEALLERWGPALTDPASTPEQKKEAEEHLYRFCDLLDTRTTLFMAVYFSDIPTHAAEMDEWNAVFEEYWRCIVELTGGDPDPSQEEIYALENRINNLCSQYRLVMAEEEFIEYNGEMRSVYDRSIPDEVRLPAVKALNAKLADILLELVDCRNRLAQIHGYESYLEYGFGIYNSDDVTPEDVIAIVRGIAPFVMPLNFISSLVHTEPAFDSFDEVIDRTRDFLGCISTDMTDLLDYLCRNDLIFCEPGEGVPGYACSIKLPSHDSALIFIGDVPGLYMSILIHEFGHATHDALAPPGTGKLDISEIHSHGLQALTLARPGMNVDERKTMMSLFHPLAGNLISVCCNAWLEYALYSGEITTVEEIEERFGQLSKYFYIPPDIWGTESSLFETPFYSSAYVTALATSLEIAAMSIEDWDAAADAYMKVQTYGMRNYGETMEYAGIPNVFEDDNVADAVQAIFGFYREVLPQVLPEIFPDGVPDIPADVPPPI